MSAAEILTLAEKYVALSTELEATRNAMRHALGNGIDAAPNPTKPPVRFGGTAKRAKPPSRDAILAQSRATDAQVVAMLKRQPMKSTDIARATSSRVSTTAPEWRGSSSAEWFSAATTARGAYRPRPDRRPSPTAGNLWAVD